MKSVLVVDDDPLPCELLTEHLAENWFVTYAVPAAREVTKMLARTPEAILLDQMLPDGDGGAICRAVAGDSVKARAQDHFSTPFEEELTLVQRNAMSAATVAEPCARQREHLQTVVVSV